MNTQYHERNISMVMDMYELTMSNGYLNRGYKDTWVAFDVFYRNNPDNGGFAIFAGLQQVVEYIENLHFSEEDVEYLRSKQLFTEEFLDYLLHFRFRGDVYAMKEGTVMYPNEPIMMVVCLRRTPINFSAFAAASSVLESSFCKAAAFSFSSFCSAS